MPETVKIKWGAASHVFQMSDISQGIPHPGSFEDIFGR